MRDSFIEKFSEMASRDNSLILITGDLGFGVFNEYRKNFPDQFINVGIAEQNMAGVATGMALEGFKVFIYSIGNFSTLRCLEQIRNDACYHEANVNVVSIGGGFSYGQLGMSHHATEDLTIMRSFPMDVFSPTTLHETKEITEWMCNNPGTKYLRLDKSMADDSLKDFNIGSPRLVRDGVDVTLIATGGILDECFQAADELSKSNISARIISIHSLSSNDFHLMEQAAMETKGFVVVEENTIKGGLSGYIAENLMEKSICPKFFERLGLRGGFSSVVGDQFYLREYYSMSCASIVSSVKKHLL